MSHLHSSSTLRLDLFKIIHTLLSFFYILQDGLVDWPYKVFLRAMSPTPLLRSAVQRFLLFTDHQGGRVYAQFTIPVKTPRLHTWKWIRDKESEGWLHLCNKCSHCKNLSLNWRKFHVKLISHSQHGKLCCTHTNGSRAWTKKQKRAEDTPHMKVFELNHKK